MPSPAEHTWFQHPTGGDGLSGDREPLSLGTSLTPIAGSWQQGRGAGQR